MTNIVNNNSNSKSLNQLIDIFFDFTYQEHSDIVKMFHEFVEFCGVVDSKVEFKKRIIPVDLYEDVEFKVKNLFAGDWEEYFNTVEIYFDTFNFEDLTIANTFYGDLYNSNDCDSKTKRFLKRKRKSKIYHASVLLKLVGRGAKSYCSHSLFNEFKLDKSKEQDFVRNNAIVGTDGKVIPLAVATKTAAQNLAEKLNVIKTMEKIAEKKEWTWCFITLTLPPEMHPNPTKGDNSYDGTSPKDSAKYLNNKIKQVRALMAKRGIKAGSSYHGAASAEAHKDGCMHKHLLMFCSSENIKAIKECFFYTFDNLNEDSFRVNDGRAKASSYVFKYVMKSVSHFDKDLDILGVTEESDKVMYNNMLNNAFRSFNQIRGFSFFGIENCMTKFRFLARNLKKLNLNVIIEEMVKANDLFALLESGFFEEVENIYVKDGETKKFVGCKVSNIKFIKNFFKMAKKEVAEKAKDIYLESARINEVIALELLGLCSKVIVNPNYSRKQVLTDQIDFKWILSHPGLFLKD